MSSQPLSRHDRRKLETQARIRESAIELFAEQGYEATKVADICQGADIARQTFFNHFPTKADLLTDIFEVGLGFTSATMDSACERGADTRERIALFLADIVRAAMDVGPLNRELVAKILQANRDAIQGEHKQDISDVFLGLVRRGVEAGDVTRRYAPEVLSELFEGALVSLMSDWGARGAFDPERRASQLASLVADALEKRPDE